MTSIRPRRKRTMKMKLWSKGKDKSLVVIQSPVREKGTASLKVKKNLWTFLPKIKRTIRIPPSMMLSSWMGSDFTNDDVVRDASFSDDYIFKLDGMTPKQDGWKISFTAKPGVVGLWKKFEIIVSKGDFLPVESKWFDRKGRLARIMTWDEVKEMGGRRIPTRMTLIPQDKKGYKTIMVYKSIQFNVNVPDSTFSLTRLERKR